MKQLFLFPVTQDEKLPGVVAINDTQSVINA